MTPPTGLERTGWINHWNNFRHSRQFNTIALSLGYYKSRAIIRAQTVIPSHRSAVQTAADLVKRLIATKWSGSIGWLVGWLADWTGRLGWAGGNQEQFPTY